jgi:hypothetical protein
MNSRRVHHLMLKNFPGYSAVEHEWINVADTQGLRRQVLSDLIGKYITADQLLIDITRHLGAFLPKPEALDFIGQHICQRDIRIADRGFKGFVVVALNGAAIGWCSTASPFISTDAVERPHSETSR